MAALELAVAVLVVVALEGNEEELPAAAGSGLFVLGDHRKCLIHEVVPQRFVKFGHLQPHPLAEVNTWSGSLLLSSLQTVVDGSVLPHTFNQQ